MIHRNFECEIILIRHGQSESNATPGMAAGADFDSPLTPKGVEQARLLGRRLGRENWRFDQIYSSTLRRAVQTTEAMVEAMGQADRPFIKVEALIEQQLPGWRGVPKEQVYTPELVAYMSGKGAHFVAPEGESLRMVERRVSRWIEDELVYNKDLVEREKSLKVAIVGHGTASQCLMHYIMGFDERMVGLMPLENCSISRFLFSSQGWSVLSINDSRHISGM